MKASDKSVLGVVSNEPRDEVQVISLSKELYAPTKVVLNCFEFSSHCPVTNQPDYATLAIEYKPNKCLVETKALKLYLWKFRDVAQFNEIITAQIASELFSQINPMWLKVTGKFAKRGGIEVQAVSVMGDLSA